MFSFFTRFSSAAVHVSEFCLCHCVHVSTVTQSATAATLLLGCYSCILSVLCYYVSATGDKSGSPLLLLKFQTLFIVYLTSLMVNFCTITIIVQRSTFFKMLRSIEMCRFIGTAGSQPAVICQCCRNHVAVGFSNRLRLGGLIYYYHIIIMSINYYILLQHCLLIKQNIVTKKNGH